MMLSNITERTHEIGIGRALGATRKAITMQFLMEALMLTLFGGTLGVALGLSGIALVSHFVDWKFSVSPFTLLVPLFSSTLIGLVFGLYPAVKAARMDPIAALRY